MISYAVRRLAAGLVLALLVTAITFFLLSFSFDDVVLSLVGPGATPEILEQRADSLGLDRPVPLQYGEWLLGVVQGDLGVSYFTNEPVGAAAISRLTVTLSIVLFALVATAIIGTALGVMAATRAGAVDRVTQSVSLVGLVVPNLLLAIMLVYVFAIQLGLFPATGFTPLTTDPGRWLASITLPTIVLVIGGVAGIAAQVRGAMIDELRKDYVRTLTTRGLPTRTIVLRYALRGAAGPALTVLSLEFIGMFSGALIIERVFALPGFGTYAFNSSLQGDIPVIMGITLFSVLLVVTVNLVVDLVGGWLNPKARAL